MTVRVATCSLFMPGRNPQPCGRPATLQFVGDSRRNEPIAWRCKDHEPKPGYTRGWERIP